VADRIECIAVGPDGTVWAGAKGGVSRLGPSAPTTTPASPTPPSSGQPTSSATTKTYENAGLGFSIQYPDNWTIASEETAGVTFLHPGQQLRVFVGIAKNAPCASGAACNARLMEDMKQGGATVEGVVTNTVDFAGATWTVSEFKHVQGAVTNNTALLSTVRGGTLYTIMNYGIPEVYNQEVKALAAMNLSFKFLGAAPATPSPTTGAAGIYRATATVKSSGGAPAIRGRVVNSAGRAVSGVNVELYNPDKQWIATVGTNADGRYEFTISAGAYYLKLKNRTSAWSPLVTVKWAQEATVDWKEQ
jgi:hypothetical protein